MSAQATLITGATGYLGCLTAQELLRTQSAPLHLWLHARDEAEYATKRERLLARLGSAAQGRVTTSWGSLRDPEPFRGVDAGLISKIIHSAALTAFNISEADANSVNIGGSEKLFDFASRCSGLTSLTYVSTIYASGRQSGPVREEPFSAETGFANHYERSKWESEQLIFKKHSSLPWKIARVATLLADGAGGHVTQQNAVHNTLKLFYYGLISLLPGKPETPVYLVLGDETTRAICAISESPRTEQIYHVCHTAPESLTLGQLVDLAFAAFGEDEGFKTRRVLKPLFTDEGSFQSLVKSVSQFGGSVLTQAVGSISPFGSQLFIRKEMDCSHMRALLPSFQAPDLGKVLPAACRYLVSTKFKKTEAA